MAHTSTRGVTELTEPKKIYIYNIPENNSGAI